jgi:hypothetical protein
MRELELTRSPGDRRLYVLDGIGTLRLEGLAGRRATTQAGGRRWQLARGAFWRRVIEALDEDGGVAGTFEPRTIRRGGPVRWGGRELALRPASAWRERYALAEGQRELAILDGKGWGRRPVKVIVDDPDAVESGLLLFTAFVVRGLAADAQGAAGGGASAAAMGG